MHQTTVRVAEGALDADHPLMFRTCEQASARSGERLEVWRERLLGV
jgi:hypothetical protein